jgi:hypothetical protein
MGELPWQLLWLDEVPIGTPHWKTLHKALVRAVVATECREQFHVGRIEIDHDWKAYRSCWSRNHRQNMSRSARRLAREGVVRFDRHTQLAPEEVETRLRHGWEVEDRSWKGRAGTAVLRTPGMSAFFHRQAGQLARWGQLELDFLSLDGRPIAFAYGMNAKGVFHSCKVGYDPQYAAYSPGQLLRYHLLEHLHADPESRAIDCMGPITDAHRSWRPAACAMGRVAIAPRRLLGRVALRAYQHCWPLLGGFQGKTAPATGASC